jgi:probable HAF family extracellular repeat protein
MLDATPGIHVVARSLVSQPGASRCRHERCRQAESTRLSHVPLAVASGTVLLLLGTTSAATPAPATAQRAAAPLTETLTSQLIDLGNLGEANAHATAVSGSVVVGTATLPGGDSHAFAYDFNAAVPLMRDLGTLGFDSTATDVDRSIVVGESIGARWSSCGRMLPRRLAAAVLPNRSWR